MFPHRPPEIGVPSENPRLVERGRVVTGFVERVGDPVPIVAADGSTHRGEQLVVDALDALIRTTPARHFESMCVAVPAHWSESVAGALRDVLATSPLSAYGAALVPDAVATLTALQAQPGLPLRGVVALCDFGGTGTSITVTDVAGGVHRVGETVRYDEFSGDLIDQEVLRNVLANLDIDPSNTSAVTALSRIREQRRIAKERLSVDTATGFTGPLPGPQSTVRLTRAELEGLIRDPLDGLIGAVEETLRHNNIAFADVAAVATAGGGASIPFVTQRLSERLRIPVITTPRPQVTAAIGAGRLAQRASDDAASTKLAMAPIVAGGAGDTTVHTMASSAAGEPLAWSQDDSPDDVIHSGPLDYDGVDPVDGARPEVQFAHGEGSAMEEIPPLPWYRRPGVLFGAAAFLAVLATVGLVLTSRIEGLSPAPAGTTGTPTTTTPPVAGPVDAPPPAAPPPATQSVVQQAPQQAPAPRRQQAPAQRVAPPPRQAPAPQPAPPPRQAPPPNPPPAPPSTAIVTSTTIVTSVAPPEPSPECTPPNCIPVPEPGIENCGYTGECPGTTTDPVIVVPEPAPENCGYTGECGSGAGSGDITPDPGGGSTGGTGNGDTEWTHCPSDLPPGYVC
ncbi:Hsp70 family protein [Mycobacterium hubeiense]|uniref:Hsp70 family protein n=1 Tax=Mycobacterium hubeiense TaxID=1867256 RepID=UPI001E47FF9E|nr:Hsp70 family protein [Mycobacterium sp. QGD 101]